MSVRYASELKRLRDGLFASDGKSDRALRESVAARAPSLSGGPESTAELPEALQAWTDKIAQHAYKTLDREVDALKAAGYDEDQIFELTIAAAFGAANARFERAIGAVKG